MPRLNKFIENKIIAKYPMPQDIGNNLRLFVINRYTIIEKYITHRDLKPENIIINIDNIDITIIDWGLSLY